MFGCFRYHDVVHAHSSKDVVVSNPFCLRLPPPLTRLACLVIISIGWCLGLLGAGFNTLAARRPAAAVRTPRAKLLLPELFDVTLDTHGEAGVGVTTNSVLE